MNIYNKIIRLKYYNNKYYNNIDVLSNCNYTKNFKI